MKKLIVALVSIFFSVSALSQSADDVIVPHDSELLKIREEIVQ